MLIQTPYPDVCFTGLVGLHGICEPKAGTPQFWADDIPGIDLEKLALTANADGPSGAKMGANLIHTAARMVSADVDAIYNGRFRVEANLVSGCTSCKFMGNYAMGTERGVLIENRTGSAFSVLVLDKLTALINETGTFHVVLDDGSEDNVQMIEHEFQAGVTVDFVNINYRTKKKKMRVYLEEDNIPLAQLSCPSLSSNCGCGGSAKAISDLIYSGTNNGVTTQQAYGFLPCALITCDSSDLLCGMAKSAPRMIGMAMLMKFAELYFTQVPFSTRINRVVNQNVDDKVDEARKYKKLYDERMQGSNSVRGVKDVVFDTLKHMTDVCVTCDTPIQTQWATG